MLSVPTSNHNIAENRYSHGVPRSFPTSNHNFVDVERREIELYIVRFLHQTTTVGSDDVLSIEVVYRPFPTSNHNFGLLGVGCAEVVYRPFPTSNHNRWTSTSTLPTVVYRPFPTSNHNLPLLLFTAARVVYRPFPTSNHNQSVGLTSCPCVVYRPFPTSNHNCGDIAPWYDKLYIVRFLHQTTTYKAYAKSETGCISSVSYIKPQPLLTKYTDLYVVYRPFPTSNHN